MTENSGVMDQITFPDQLTPANRSDPYTGDVSVRVPGGVGRSAKIRIENSAAQPATILGIFQEVGISEGGESE
jgi:hypothetical protein